MRQERPDPEEVDDPPNLPDNLEEKADRVFEHVGGTVQTDKLYYFPMQGDGGPKDYEVMLDIMGLDEVGTVFDLYDRRYMVTDTFETSHKWPGDKDWTNTALEAIVLKDEENHWDRGKKLYFKPGDEYLNVTSLWKKYLYDKIDILGNVDDLES